MTLFIDGGGFCSFWYCLGAITKVPKTFERVESVSSGAIVATLFVCMDYHRRNTYPQSCTKIKAVFYNCTVNICIDG